MPTYNPGSPVALGSGSPYPLFNAEITTNGELSQQGTISSPSAVSVTVSFAADPGEFEFQIMEADADMKGNYVPVPGVLPITKVNSNFAARVDIPSFIGAYIAILSKWGNVNGIAATVAVRKVPGAA